MEKATIFDYARMCKFYDDCSICPLGESNCHMLISENPDKANEIILNWCKEHPIKTRQSEFLKMFPNARVNTNGILDVCPKIVNIKNKCTTTVKKCGECCKDYWLTEVNDGK